MELWRSVGGILEVELVSAEPELALGAINAEGIEITDLRRKDDLTYTFSIHRGAYPKLLSHCRKREEKLRIVRGYGVYWTVKRLVQRPVLTVGLLLLFTLTLYLPSRIFFVRIEGNSSIPEKQILAAADACGIGFGASRREVRSEKVKNALLAAIPQLQWAGVNTAGCVATISVRERSLPEKTEKQKEVSSLVAVCDGYITSVTATSGNPLVQPGQTVRKDQTLISGFTDCGICIQATRAEGEVMARTKRELEAVTPAVWAQQRESGAVGKKYSLLVGKKRINLWKDSGISGNSCGRMYEEYYVTLPGGFSLPLALCVETQVGYETEYMEVPSVNAELALSEFGRRYILSQMHAGQIHGADCVVSLEANVYRLRGFYDCEEMIARQQPEQIGDTNGKND